MVIKIVGLDRSPKVAALMIGCWSRDILFSVLTEMGQGDELPTLGGLRTKGRVEERVADREGSVFLGPGVLA